MPAGGSFYRRVIPFGGIIDHTWTEVKIDSFIRAMFFPPFRGAIAKFDGIKFEVDNIDQYTKIRKQYLK